MQNPGGIKFSNSRFERFFFFFYPLGILVGRKRKEGGENDKVGSGSKKINQENVSCGPTSLPSPFFPKNRPARTPPPTQHTSPFHKRKDPRLSNLGTMLDSPPGRQPLPAKAPVLGTLPREQSSPRKELDGTFLPNSPPGTGQKTRPTPVLPPTISPRPVRGGGQRGFASPPSFQHPSGLLLLLLLRGDGDPPDSPGGGPAPPRRAKRRSARAGSVPLRSGRARRASRSQASLPGLLPLPAAPSRLPIPGAATLASSCSALGSSGAVARRLPRRVRGRPAAVPAPGEGSAGWRGPGPRPARLPAVAHWGRAAHPRSLEGLRTLRLPHAAWLGRAASERQEGIQPVELLGLGLSLRCLPVPATSSPSLLRFWDY